MNKLERHEADTDRAMEINLSKGVVDAMLLSVHEFMRTFERKHKAIPEDLMTAWFVLCDLQENRDALLKEANNADNSI